MIDYMVLDAYNRDKAFYQICNIYYDTIDDRLIRASIEKPVYKEKLRLRSYGTPDMNDNVFVEIKKKYNGIVNKRRTSMTLRRRIIMLIIMFILIWKMFILISRYSGRLIILKITII